MASTGTLISASEFRVLVTGSREWADETAIWTMLGIVHRVALRFGLRMVLIHGKCPRGADECADQWGSAYRVEIRDFPANWSLGRRAGRIRNTHMVNVSQPHLGLAFHLNNSNGTAHCVSEMVARGIPVVRLT